MIIQQQQSNKQFAVAIRIGRLQYFNYPYHVQSIYVKIKQIKHQFGTPIQILQQRTYQKQKSKAKWFEDFYLNNVNVDDGLDFILVLNEMEMQSNVIWIKDYLHTFNTSTQNMALEFKCNILMAVIQLEIGLHENQDSIGGILLPRISLKQMRTQQSSLNINRLEVTQIKNLNIFSCLDRLQEYQSLQFWPPPFARKRYLKK